jgi:hypothetical protein
MKRSLLFTITGAIALAMILPSTIFSQTGPGGVGATDGSSALELWMRGETGTLLTSSATNATATGDPVAEWRDLSGNGRHATAASTPTDRRPLLRAGTDGLNGQAILRFDGTNDFLRTGTISPALSQPFTLFTLSRKLGSATTALTVADSRTSGTNTLTQGYWTNTTQARINAGTNLTLAITQNDFTILRGVFDGASSSLAANGGTAATGNIGVRAVDGFTIGATRNSDGFLNGDIAEVIAYSRVLNAAERRIVENYLSARYAIAITGDHFSSSTHIADLVGIGREGSAVHGASRAAGLVLEDDGFLADDGDYIIAAHDGAGSDAVGDDLPTGLEARWGRIWYIEKTAAGTGSGDVTLGFDLGDGGFEDMPGSASNYRLLYRSGTSGDFSELTVSTTIDGDRVLFDVPESTLSSGYYTLGMVNAEDSPLPVELSSFTLSLESGHVVVAWATASERQNAGFLLSRSAGDSGIFTPIASHLSDPRLKGAGTSSTRTDYRFVDPTVLAPGRYRYHLEQVDFDGNPGLQDRLSSITIEGSTDGETRFALDEIAPNPVATGAILRYSLRNDCRVTVTLRDRLGRTISTRSIEADAGPRREQFDLSAIPPGVYFITMQVDGFVRTRRVVVER